MTRETKIGLLVGLAFIIVIGILLSDHMTSTTEPVQAPLADAGSDVRKSVTALAPDNPPITTIVTPPSPIAPRQPVPIQGETAAPRPGESIVRVGPGNYVVPPAITIHSPQPTQNTQIASGSQDIPERRAASDGSPSGDIIPQQLQQAAREQGEQLVPAGPQAAEQHEYIAQAGDSVSRMAARLLGANNRANRDAIVKANLSLQQDPNKVVVGRKYLIPAIGGAPLVAGARVPAPALSPAPAPAPAPAEVDSHTNWYTVKANDNLWRIAEDQLGDAASVSAIKELNKDVLKGSDAIRPGMRLRLPAKSVASAQ